MAHEDNTNAGVQKLLGVNGKIGNAARDNPPAKLKGTVVDDPHFGETAAETIERCRLDTERRNAATARERMKRRYE